MARIGIRPLVPCARIWMIAPAPRPESSSNARTLPNNMVCLATRASAFGCSARFFRSPRNRARRACALSRHGKTGLPARSRNNQCAWFPLRFATGPTAKWFRPKNTTVLHRENIYGSGPPIEEAGIEVSNLLHAYLPAGASVIDVGCGAGAYGPGLIAAGHDWLGTGSEPALL